MRNLVLDIQDTIMCEDLSIPLQYAKKMLKKYTIGTLLIKCFNGKELYIKESNGKVRVSTQEEFDDYFKKKKSYS